VPSTTSHKHLGVTFSNDAKWNNHVDNIKSSVSKHLNILRKLKYRLSRTNLDKLCFLLFRLADNNSQPVSLYKISVLVKIGKPVTILAAST
jgi:hypothetical protein